MACFEYFLNLLMKTGTGNRQIIWNKGAIVINPSTQRWENRELIQGQGHPQPKIRALLDHFQHSPVKEPKFFDQF